MEGAFAALVLLYVYALLWGLRKGSVVCVTVCAPGLIPYVAEKEMSWREGFRTGVIFNIPRVLLLTAIGAVMGLASFALLENDTFVETTGKVGVLGYVLVGGILFVYGIYVLMTALEEHQDMAEGKPTKCRGAGMPHSRLAVWFAKRFGGKEGDPFLFLWGAVLGLACIGETVVTLEGAMLGGFVGSYGPTWVVAMLLGATVMFVFSVGAAIPVLIVTSASGRLSELLKAREKVVRIKFASSVLLILVGMALLFLFGVRAIL